MNGRSGSLTTLLLVAAIAWSAAAIACGGGRKAPAALLTPDSAALAAPAPDSFDVVFETSKGNFTMRARRAWSPHGVDRFHYLAANGFFDDVRFFRTVPGFVVQFGISGNPAISAAWQDRNIPDDSVMSGNKKGRVTFAKGGPNSRTTQLFINLVDNDRLDAMGFPAFAEIIDGMSVVESLNGEYGEAPTGKQGEIAQRGNAYLAQAYPNLDYIKTARIIPGH